MKTNWEDTYGELKNGTYRIVKFVFGSAGGREFFYAPFTIE